MSGHRVTLASIWTTFRGGATPRSTLVHEWLENPSKFSLKCNNSGKMGLQRHLRHHRVPISFGKKGNSSRAGKGGPSGVQSPPQWNPFCGSAGLQLEVVGLGIVIPINFECLLFHAMCVYICVFVCLLHFVFCISRNGHYELIVPAETSHRWPQFIALIPQQQKKNKKNTMARINRMRWEPNPNPKLRHVLRYYMLLVEGVWRYTGSQKV